MNKNVLLITSEEIKKGLVVDVKLWKNYDVVIFTPTIMCGVSCTDEHFDMVCGYLNNLTISAVGFAQMLKRVRNCDSIEVYYNTFFNNKKILTSETQFDEYFKNINLHDTELKSGFEPEMNYITQEPIQDEYYWAVRNNRIQADRDRCMMINRLAGLLDLQGIDIVFSKDDESDPEELKKIKEILDTEVEHTKNIKDRKLNHILNICRAPNIDGQDARDILDNNKGELNFRVQNKIIKYRFNKTYNTILTEEKGLEKTQDVYILLKPESIRSTEALKELQTKSRSEWSELEVNQGYKQTIDIEYAINHYQTELMKAIKEKDTVCEDMEIYMESAPEIKLLKYKYITCCLLKLLDVNMYRLVTLGSCSIELRERIFDVAGLELLQKICNISKLYRRVTFNYNEVMEQYNSEDEKEVNNAVNSVVKFLKNTLTVLGLNIYLRRSNNGRLYRIGYLNQEHMGDLGINVTQNQKLIISQAEYEKIFYKKEIENNEVSITYVYMPPVTVEEPVEYEPCERCGNSKNKNRGCVECYKIWIGI